MTKDQKTIVMVALIMIVFFALLLVIPIGRRPIEDVHSSINFGDIT